MGSRKRNYLGKAAGELVVRLPKRVKDRVKPVIKDGQGRAPKGKETLTKTAHRWFWGKKKR